jgi:tRNA threonylcarbamoyladenosine biosynthesis protein TsaE
MEVARVGAEGRFRPAGIMPSMPILDERTLEFFSRSPEQTRRVGMRLGGSLQPGDVICLQGELGTGKTTLAQGLAEGWGAADDVSSPTFVLVNIYRRPDGSEMFHVDAYRIDSPREAEELDLDALMERGPVIIEWAERMGSVVPAERLWINLEHVEDEHRRLVFRADGPRSKELLEAVRASMVGAR